MENFADKVIIVTGASEGIGRALCLELAQHQTRLVLVARNNKRLQQLKSEVEAKGSRALAVVTDVKSKEECEKMVKDSINTFGQIDILVNNAGRSMWTSFEEISDLSLVEDLMQLNYMGSVYCTYYALPWIKKAKGMIVPVASAAGMTGVPQRTAYSASKHAMIGFFDSLRIELKDSGVTVTNIIPDFVLSELHKRAYDKDGQSLGVSPMQESKITTSEECAKMILKAMMKRDRVCITSTRAKVGRVLKVFAPNLVDSIAAKAIRDKK